MNAFLITCMTISLFLSVDAHASDLNQTSKSQYNKTIDIAERLIRLEEGQKMILDLMKARAEAVDKRFESLIREMNNRFESLIGEMNNRFESLIGEMNNRFESVDQRFESVDQRFESLIREMNNRFESLDQRFESLIREMNKRFEAIDQRIDQQNLYFIAILSAFVTMFVSIIGLAIWDRKSAAQKLASDKSSQEKTEAMVKQLFDKYQEVLFIMNKLTENKPEMREMMYRANFLQ